MSTAQPWVSGLLRKFSLRERAVDASWFNHYRKLMDRSRLPERMDAACIAINAQSGGGLMYEQSLTQSDPLIRRYMLKRENRDLTMDLVILFDGPRVLISSNKANPWIKSFQRCFGYSKEGINRAVCELVIDPMAVSEDEVRRWFTYLVSGLQDSYKPQGSVPLLKTG